jgi:hypothetical protein
MQSTQPSFFSRRNVVILAFVLAVILSIAILVKVRQQKPEPVAPVVTPPVVKTDPRIAVLGQSIENRKIESYTFGKGDTHMALVGGIHGGYEWNTILLAYKIIDYLTKNPEIIPDNLTVAVIPNANPDGLARVVSDLGDDGRFTESNVEDDESIGLGRFNANDVDLNRNFDCRWQPESTWRSKKVKAGDKPFSEPESKIIRDFVEDFKPVSILFWHSQGGAVYASKCTDGILPETLKIMSAYASASGYNAVKTFSAYPTTGDADSWLASIGIPAITAELKTHTNIEFDKNLAGVKALLNYYASKPSEI